MMPWLRLSFLLFCTAFSKLQGQDTLREWFPGGDPGFYRYLEDRLQALGSQKPPVDRNGESIVFEFYITDSGFVDSVQVQQCFNFQLCFQLRQILETMPRLDPPIMEGKPVSERRVFVLDFKRYRDGYLIEPSIYIPYQGTLSSKMKWIIVIVAVVTMLVVIVK